MIRLLILSPVFVTTLYGAVDSQQAVTALASHNRAVHLLDDWMRDPYIVLAADGWFYLTCTRRSHIDGGKQGIQVWRSRSLAKWEDLGTPFQDKQGRWWCTAFSNGVYVSPEHVAKKGTDPNRAETINKQGLTLIPLDVRVKDSDVQIRAKDANYAKPGPEEVQDF